VESPTSITVAVTLAPGAPVGPREVFVTGSAGTSNSLPFRVTARTEGASKRQ